MTMKEIKNLLKNDDSYQIKRSGFTVELYKDGKPYADISHCLFCIRDDSIINIKYY